MAQDYGLIDLLKTLDNRKYPRSERFKILGVMNEPGVARQPSRMNLACGSMSKWSQNRQGIDETVYGKPSVKRTAANPSTSNPCR
jgi:hypothetical protein